MKIASFISCVTHQRHLVERTVVSGRFATQAYSQVPTTQQNTVRTVWS